MCEITLDEARSPTTSWSCESNIGRHFDVKTQAGEVEYWSCRSQKVVILTYDLLE